MRNRHTVENDDLVALPQQGADKMGTDEARAARYENTHETSPGMSPRLKEARVLPLNGFCLRPCHRMWLFHPHSMVKGELFLSFPRRWLYGWGILLVIPLGRVAI